MHFEKRIAFSASAVLLLCHPEDPKTKGRDHQCGDDVAWNCGAARPTAQGAAVSLPPRRRLRCWRWPVPLGEPDQTNAAQSPPFSALILSRLQSTSLAAERGLELCETSAAVTER